MSISTSVISNGTISQSQLAAAFDGHGDTVVNMSVEQIENGFLVLLAQGQGVRATRTYIQDLDELAGVVTAHIAAKRIKGGP